MLIQETQRGGPNGMISDVHQPNLRQVGFPSTSFTLAGFNNLEAKLPIKKETSSYQPYLFNKMQENMHNNQIASQEDMQVKMDTDAYRGLRF